MSSHVALEELRSWNVASGSGHWEREETIAASQFNSFCILRVPKGPLKDAAAKDAHDRLPGNQMGVQGLWRISWLAGRHSDAAGQPQQCLVRFLMEVIAR